MRLGWAAMLCHVYELRHEISVFMEKKDAEVATPYGCVILHFSLRHGAPHSAERQTPEKRTTNQ